MDKFYAFLYNAYKWKSFDERMLLLSVWLFGLLAQLVEHRICNAGVRSSNLLQSTE